VGVEALVSENGTTGILVLMKALCVLLIREQWKGGDVKCKLFVQACDRCTLQLFHFTGLTSGPFVYTADVLWSIRNDS